MKEFEMDENLQIWQPASEKRNW